MKSSYVLRIAHSLLCWVNWQWFFLSMILSNHVETNNWHVIRLAKHIKTGTLKIHRDFAVVVCFFWDSHSLGFVAVFSKTRHLGSVRNAEWALGFRGGRELTWEQLVSTLCIPWEKSLVSVIASELITSWNEGQPGAERAQDPNRSEERNKALC